MLSNIKFTQTCASRWLPLHVQLIRRRSSMHWDSSWYEAAALSTTWDTYGVTIPQIIQSTKNRIKKSPNISRLICNMLYTAPNSGLGASSQLQVVTTVNQGKSFDWLHVASLPTLTNGRWRLLHHRLVARIWWGALLAVLGADWLNT